MTTTTVNESPLKNLQSRLRSIASSRWIPSICLCMTCIACLYSSSVYGEARVYINTTSILIFLCLVIAVYFSSDVLFTQLEYFHDAPVRSMRGKLNVMASNMYTRTPSQIWAFWGIPVYVLLCSQFFYVGSNTNVLLVNSKPITSGITFAIPFYDSIVSIKTDQSVELWTTATTKDKVFVRGTINVELDLDSNTSYWTSNDKIKQDAMNAVGESFESAVSHTNAADLWNLIPLEAEIAKTSLNQTGTRWRPRSSVRIIKINVMTPP